MTGAELKTAREYIGLSVAWLAQQADVRPRTVSYWECQNSPVPEDVAHILEKVLTLRATLILALEHQLAAGTTTFYRYREDQHLWEEEPAIRPLPAITHAMALFSVKDWAKRNNLPEPTIVWAAKQENTDNPIQ